ncbi:hypothetical protein NPIL_94131 [Nephila pilipes]|uniref:Uncharacterized protein n=1 Tax=Nephila pilipes TaxID=299642 RepID=A0A8X6TS09_NEPPI|nr:hypothetical protein NPIL_94131 [Nephila pilipes]
MLSADEMNIIYASPKRVIKTLCRDLTPTTRSKEAETGPERCNTYTDKERKFLTTESVSQEKENTGEK